jgi:hypothetical protein
MGDNTGYNGWKNYGTWNFALWYDNDFSDDAWESLNNAEVRYSWEDKKLAAIRDFEDYLKNFVDERVEELDLNASFLSDILGEAIERIDFREIATNWIDNIYEDWLEQNPQDDNIDEEESDEE